MDSRLQKVIESELSEEEAAKVIAALEAVTTDPPVGAVFRNPATGDVATYVRQYAETYWRVVSVDDRSWVETEALVGWDALYKPTVEAPVEPPPAPEEGATKD